jgi:hypothetical protein
MFSMAPGVLPFPLSSGSFFVLIVVLIVMFQVLHAIFVAFPSITWWWKVFSTHIKTFEVEGLGHTLGVSSWSRLAKRRHNSRHSGASDVEKGLPS